MVKKTAPHQWLAALALAAILSVFVLPVWAGERTHLTLAVGNTEDGQGELADQLTAALLAPEDLTQCKKTSSCLPSSLRLQRDASSSAAAALTKLRAGLAQLVVLPSPLAQVAASGVNKALPNVAGLQILAALAPANIFVLVGPKHPVLALSSLQGARIALGTKNSDVMATTQLLFARMGLPESSVTLLRLADPADRLRRILRGQADTVVMVGSELPPDYRAALQEGKLQLLSFGKTEIQQALLGFAGVKVVSLELGVGPAYRTLQFQQLLLTTAALPLETGQDLRLRLERAIKRGAFPRLKPEDILPALPLHQAAASAKPETVIPAQD